MRLEANNLYFRYDKKGPWILEDISISLDTEERVGLVGPSGYGKSTLAKLLSGYEKPEKGEIRCDGKPLPTAGICPVQLIFQHPEKAINPRWKMGQVLAESNMSRQEVIAGLGIEKEWLERYPRELSGGELQRFCVARSLFDGVKFLLADEMSTMLDVITQAQIWQLMLSETAKRHIGLLVITHNRALAERVCTRVIDITDGKLK